MSTESQVAALLALIDNWRDKECKGLADAAEQECRRIRNEARKESRKQVQEAIREARLQKAHAQQVRQAEQVQREAASRQQAGQRLLAAGMDLLRQRLQARWRQSHTRAQWVQLALRQAMSVLPQQAQGWRIDHPSTWPADEQTAFAREIQAQGRAAPQFNPCGQLEGGIRICAGGACIDTTIDGLLRDEVATKAQLLGLIQDMAHE